MKRYNKFWNCIATAHTSQLSRIWDCRFQWLSPCLPVSIFYLQVSEPKQYFAAFSKQSHKSGLSPLFITYHETGCFGTFFKFLFILLSSMLLLGKKTFSPSCTAFQIRCTAMHTWHAAKSLNIGEFGKNFRGDFGQPKRYLLFLKYDFTFYYKATC